MKKISKIVLLASVLALVAGLSMVSAQTARRGGGRAKTPTYTLTINSNVRNAQIYIDNSPHKANLPYSVTLDQGNHTVRLEASGYHNATATVNLTSNQTVNITMKPLTARLVPIKHHPDMVFIVDGKQIYNPTEVPPGTHTIEYRVGALKAVKTYTFEAGQVYQLEAELIINIKE